MTNKTLYNLLKEAFPDVVSGFWEGFPHTQYSNEYIADKIEVILDKLKAPDFYGSDATTLSRRQKFLAYEVSEFCRKTEDRLLGGAIHQLADCIDNYCEDERYIYPSEHLLYYTLLTLIEKTTKG